MSTHRFHCSDCCHEFYLDPEKTLVTCPECSTFEVDCYGEVPRDLEAEVTELKEQVAELRANSIKQANLIIMLNEERVKTNRILTLLTKLAEG